MKRTPTYLFTHTDLDGAGCAIVARARFGDRIQISHHDYTSFDEDVVKALKSIRRDSNAVVYLADICPNDPKTIERIKKLAWRKSMRVTILDHHASKQHFDDRKGFASIKIDTSACGTKLLYHSLFGTAGGRDLKPLKSFVNLVDVYDRWVLDSPSRPMSERLNHLFNFMGMERFVDRGPVPKLTDAENMIVDASIDKRVRLVEWAASSAVELSFDFAYGPNFDSKGKPVVGRRHRVVVFPSSMYASDVASHSLKTHPDAEFAVFVDFGRFEVGLRSRSGFDVGAIAKNYGGGGHPGAAGFGIAGNESTARRLINLYIKGKQGSK